MDLSSRIPRPLSHMGRKARPPPWIRSLDLASPKSHCVWNTASAPVRTQPRSRTLDKVDPLHASYGYSRISTGAWPPPSGSPQEASMASINRLKRIGWASFGLASLVLVSKDAHAVLLYTNGAFTTGAT